MSHAPRSRCAMSSVLVAALAACGGADTGGDRAPSEMSSADEITVSGVGFSTPESVLHDPAADVYLVSNINGAPLDKDGNGFISRLSPDGEVLDLKWIDGASEGVMLSAPKGMALRDGVLYVTDIDCIRQFDATSGSAVGSVCVEGASFLNDLALNGAGDVVFTDLGRDASFSPTGMDAVYRLDGDGYTAVLEPTERGGPNGLAPDDGSLIVVTFFSGEIFRLDAGGARTDILSVEGAQYDGVEVLENGALLVSDWGESCVHLVTPQGESTCMIGDVDGPADIGIDRGRDRILIPLFMANEVWIRPIG